MSLYVDKIQALNKQKLQLVERHKNLIEKRKKQIVTYLEKFNLLDVSDALLCGSFAHLKQAIENKDTKEIESLGTKFLHNKSRRGKVKKDTATSTKTSE